MSNRRNEVDSLASIAIAEGWRVEHTARGHVKFIPRDPSREIIVTGGTTSDHRRLVKLKSDLRRSGLQLPR